MPPILALFLTAGFIAFLFRRDFREKPNVTGALWIPTLWFLILGSRTVSQWLEPLGLGISGSYEEGTPVDATVYFLLIIAGIWVLQRRRIRLSEIVRSNRWLVIFFIYCLISVLWSDLPFVAFKRWIKILGHPVMTLVLLTEPDPEEAIVRLMKRCAYVIVPVSILFIRYFPEWGRVYDPWGGPAELTGITLDKNTLGSICFILELFFFWFFLKTLKDEKSRARKIELIICGAFLWTTGWLLHLAHSSTSVVSLLVGAATILILGLPFVNKNYIGTYVLVVGIVGVMLNYAFDITGQVIQLLGKDPTLTDRMPLWREVLSMQTNPLFGTGFESFWLGERRELLWSHHWWHPIQAHNGYLETYLNLGLVGLALMVIWILTAFFKGRRALLAGIEFGRFRLGFIAAFVFYNWTEAAFKAVHPVWFVFYIVAMDYPRSQPEITAGTAGSSDNQVENAAFFETSQN